MQNKKISKPEIRKKTGRKILKWFFAIVLVLIVLVFLLTPIFVSSEKCRQLILSKINSIVEGRTNFADLSMGWWKGVKVADFSFDDNKGQVSVRVKQIATKPHYVSLLTGSLSFGQTLVDEPQVQVNLKDRQAPEVAQHKAPSPKPQPFTLPIKNIDLTVKDGALKVTDPKAQTIVLSQINSTVNLRPPGRPTSFNIDTSVADKTTQSRIHISGTITPPSTKTGWTLKGTTGDVTIEVNDLDLQSLAPLLAIADVQTRAKGRISANIKSQIKDGQFENLSGIIKGKNLDITDPQLKGDRFQTKILDATVKLTHAEQKINIDNLKLKTDWANLSAAGTVPTTLKSLSDFLQPDTTYNLKGSFDCDLPAVLSQMPRTLGLKEGTKISSGKLTGNIDTLSQPGKKHIQASATLAELQGEVDGKKIALSQPLNAQAQISSDKTGLTFDKLDVSASFAKVNCTGNTKRLQYDADVDLAKFQSELGQFVNLGQYQIAGQLAGTGQLSIADDIISAAGSSTIKNLRLNTKEAAASEPLAKVAFAFDVDRQNNFIALKSLKADAALGQVNIIDAVLPLSEKSAKPLRLAVSTAALDLQKAQPFAVLFASFPKQLQLSGIADSTISITCEKDTYAVITDSTKIKNLKLIYADRPPFEQTEASLVLDARLNPAQKTINLKKLQLISPQIKIHKAEITEVARAGKTQITGRLDCEYDWAAISPQLPQGLIVKGTNKLPIEFSSEYPTGQRDKLLDNLSTKGTLGFSQAQYLGLVFERTEAQIQIQNGSFTILPFSTKVNNGQFHFAGQGDLKQKPTFLRAAQPMQIMKDIQINDEMGKKLLMYVNPIFANAFNLSGTANFSCERLAIPLAKNKLNDIEIVGNISINKLRLQASGLLTQILSIIGVGFTGTDITLHPTKFALRNGILGYDDMQIDIGNNPVNFKGAIGLDMSLKMSVTLPYTIQGRIARVGRESPGQRITLPIKGTLDKPELDLAKLLEEQLKQTLLEGLDSLLK